jgi:hypothetical protein
MRRGSHSKVRGYDDGAIDIFAFVSLKYMNIIFSLPTGQNQLTIADEHIKNNDPIKNILDILDNIH